MKAALAIWTQPRCATVAERYRIRVSINYYLYRAPAQHKGMHEDGDESIALGKPEAIKSKLMQLFPQISSWEQHENSLVDSSFNYPIFYNSIIKENCVSGIEYVDITLMEHGDKFIHIIDITNSSFRIIEKIYESLQLTCAWNMQACEVIDPYHQY